MTEEQNILCPDCEGELILRTNHTDGSEFYGCENYPDCKYTENFIGVHERL